MPMTEASCSPRFHALIPCAGVGSRAGTSMPKQYQHIAGQPLVMHTVLALAQVAQIESGAVLPSGGVCKVVVRKRPSK